MLALVFCKFAWHDRTVSSRNVVVYEFMCLDGVAEDVAGFFTGGDDDEVDAVGAAVIATQDAVILGRRSYDEWAPFWPGSEIEPFATFINSVPEVRSDLLTAQPRVGQLQCDRRQAGRLRARAEEPTRRRHRRPCQHLVAQALLAAGVVDELRLVIAQAIAGVGRKLLDGLPPIRLTPIRSSISPTGFLILDYRIIE